MTNHDDLMRDLPLLLDGELPPERAAEVRAAVQRDPVLAQRARELRAVDRLLELHPTAGPPPGLAGRILAGAGQSGAIGTSSRWLKPGNLVRLAVAAGLLAAAVAFWRPWAGASATAEDPVTLGDYGVLAGRPAEPAPDPDLEAAWREIESVGQIWLPLG